MPTTNGTKKPSNSNATRKPRPQGYKTSPNGTKRPSSTYKKRPSSQARPVQQRRPSSKTASGRPTSKGNGGNLPPQKKTKIQMLVLALLVIVVIISAFTLVYFKRVQATLEDTTFYKGIYIDGINVEGKTKEEVIGLLTQAHTSDLENLSLTVTFAEENLSWHYDYQSLDARFNIKEIVEQAYAYGRQGEWRDDYKLIKDLEKSPKYYDITLTYDPSLMDQELNMIADAIYIEVKDASLVFDAFVESAGLPPRHTFNADDDDEIPDFNISEAVVGREVNRDQMKAEILDLLTESATNGTPIDPYEVPVKVLTPKANVDDIKLYTERISEFYTAFGYRDSKANRAHNVQLFAKLVDGQIIMPGEEFSLNDTTGIRDEAAGFLPAHIIVAGEYEDAAGGGNCQVSSTIYNAALLAGLEIVERINHTIPSTYIDAGLDSTVNFPNKDLVIRNNTEYPVFLNTYVKYGSYTAYLHADFYGIKPTEWAEIQLTTRVVFEGEVPEIVDVYVEEMEDGEIEEKNSHAHIIMEAFRIFIDADGNTIRTESLGESDYPEIIGEFRHGLLPTPTPDITLPDGTVPQPEE